MDVEFRFSKHSEEQILSRGLNKAIILDILSFPDYIVLSESSLAIYQKIVTEVDKPYLYRVFVNQDLDPKLIVTVYKTSKFDKYENKI